jgi:hypothetical protein
MSTLTVGTIQSNTTSPPIVTNSGSTEIGTFCRAWVSFNGTTVTNPASMTGVRGSFNVSSILDNGVGNYTVNFTTAMPDANYAVVFNNHAQSDHIYVGGVFAYNTSSVQCYYGTTGVVGSSASTRVDAASYGLAIFR